MQGKAQIPFNNVALFTGFSLLVFTSLALAAWLNEPTIAALPVGLLIAYLAITDFRKIFYLLLFMLPLSTEFDISPGLATDLPTEPLMVGLMLVMIIFMVSNPSKLDIRFFKHPIIVFVILHALWVLVAAFYSEVYLVSFKFLAAKLWYIFVFVFMAAMIIRDEKIFRKAFWVIFIPLFFTIIQTIIRHSITGFAFSEINPVVVPFYRNHVLSIYSVGKNMVPSRNFHAQVSQFLGSCNVTGYLFCLHQGVLAGAVSRVGLFCFNQEKAVQCGSHFGTGYGYSHLCLPGRVKQIPGVCP